MMDAALATSNLQTSPPPLAAVTPPTFFIGRELFLRGLGIIYLIAFVSLWVQIDGLAGSSGLLPVESLMEAVHKARAQAPESVHPFWKLPTLFMFWPGDGALDAICALGTVLALVLTAGVAPIVCLVGLWILYLSLMHASGVFLSFQWDILLLETGSLAIFLAPARVWPRWRDPSPVSRVARWLVWWLLFRLMFASGVVKLASADASWWDMTALTFHYETQPLPTWIGWYLHQLPEWFQKLSTAVVFLVELVLPFLIFTWRHARHCAGLAFILFMVLIALSGNYGYFNYLTVVLCLSLFDDRFFAKHGRTASSSTSTEAASIEGKPRRTLHVLRACGMTRWPGIFVAPILLLIIFLSPYQLLFRTFRLQAPDTETIAALYYEIGRDVTQHVSPFFLINSYGLFANMTETRPEILIERSEDARNWEPYAFRWKPDRLDRSPSFVQPHMPRLDWQLWFAALRLESYLERVPTRRQEYLGTIPWLQNLILRLFQHEPTVVDLLGPATPARDEPPRFLRLTVYQYRFTALGSDEWWQRDRGEVIAIFKNPFLADKRP